VTSQPAPRPSATGTTRSFAFHRNLTLASLIVGYMAYYLCRQNFSSAYPLLHASLGLSKERFGAVASVGTLVYALGKIVSGPLADARGGRRVFFLGLYGSAAATLLIAGAAPSLIALFALWGVNRLFQSAGWGGVLSVLSRWYKKRDYGTASGALSVSYQLGGAVAGGVCALLAGFGWRALFIGPAVLAVLIGFGLRFTLRRDPAEVGYALPDEPAAAAAPAEAPLSLGHRLWLLLQKPSFLIVCALSFVLTLIRETFNTWLPAYFTDVGAKADAASLKSALFPLLGCVGTLLAGWLSDRVWAGRRGPIMALFLVGGGLSLLGLAHPAAAAGAIGAPRDAMLLALTGATGFFILAPYSMVGGGVLALDAGGRDAAATAAGLLDGIGYLGATTAGYGVATAVARGGWEASFGAMAASVFGCAVLSVVLWWRVERRRI
jgi:sugar phosphate permease